MNTIFMMKRVLARCSAIYKKTYYRGYSDQPNIKKNPFMAPIPYEYVGSKEKALIFVLKPNQILKDVFCESVKNTVGRNVLYTVFVRVKLVKDEYRMVGNQMGFRYRTDKYLDWLFNDIEMKIEEFYQDYKSSSKEITNFQFNFRKNDKKLLAEFGISSSKESNLSSDEGSSIFGVDSNTKLSVTPISLYGIYTLIKNPIVKLFDRPVSVIKYNRNSYATSVEVKKLNNIPISINEDYLGELLSTKSKDNIITHIQLNIDDQNVNFLDLIEKRSEGLHSKHPDNIRSFSSGFKFYLNRDTRNYVLGINKIHEFRIEKIRFSMYGAVLNHVIDSRDGDIINRKFVSNNKEIKIKGTDITVIKKPLLLKPIPKILRKKEGFIANPNIGVIDTETFVSDRNSYSNKASTVAIKNTVAIKKSSKL